MRIYFLLLFWITAACTSHDSVEGAWQWTSENEQHLMELDLVKSGNQLLGKHCNTFFNGNKIDCAETNSLVLHQVSNNVYEGTFQSSFSDANIPIKITYIADGDKIYLQQLGNSELEYYMAFNVYLTK
ncbi:MAG: hypothetical protein KGZ81_04520 [Flavobacteriales bacterium]|nr:hypothetical protein [Flavobacteriales bacterium]